ncbi:MAG: hypothetical protein JNJ46_14580 [Myxococcales bacterium]|nr:hypothetical protein [Myxococcales bacterium]
MQLDPAIQNPPAEVAPAPPPQAAETPASPAPRKPRGQLLVSVGLMAGGTTWQGDPLGTGSLLLGLRLFRTIALFAQGRLGYARIDERQLTAILIGLMGGGYLSSKVYGRISVSFIHQHEESIAAVAEQPGGALLGIGTGIRHRAGVQGNLGVDFVAYRQPKYELTVGPEVALSYLTYSTGPSVYGFVGLSVGGAFQLF